MTNGTGTHRVWTDDMRHSFTRLADEVVVERTEYTDGLRFMRPILRLSHRDFVDMFAGLCDGAAQMSTHNFALLRAELARVWEGRP